MLRKEEEEEEAANADQLQPSCLRQALVGLVGDVECSYRMKGEWSAHTVSFFFVWLITLRGKNTGMTLGYTRMMDCLGKGAEYQSR